MAVYKRFTIQQKYLNGVPQEEYRLGMEYDPKAYHSMENCESGTECTQVEYRWIDVEGEYICEDTTKYAKQKRQQKCVDEEEWVDMYPYQYKKGEKMEEESEDCGAQPVVDYFKVYGITDGYGTIKVTPQKEQYTSEETVLIEATPNQGYIFDHYLYGRTSAYGSSTTQSMLNLTTSHDWYVKAMFSSVVVPIDYYNLITRINGNGYITVSPSKESYMSGDVVQLIPTASDGYQFNNWQYGSTTAYGFTTTNVQLNLTMYNNMYVLANFSKESQSGGNLYIKYLNGTESYYNHTDSFYWIFNTSTYNVSSATIIIDYGGNITDVLEVKGGYKALLSVSFPMCKVICEDAFKSCSTLISVDFPMCSSIAYGAFGYCSRLTSINFPMCKENDGFQSCYALREVRLPECTTLGWYCFNHCTSLYLIDAPKCETIGSSCFDHCINLVSVDFPMCSYVGKMAFCGCYKLKNVRLPKCIMIGEGVFLGDDTIISVSIPLCEYIDSRAFEDCYSLQSISLPKCSYIGASAFRFCSELQTVYAPKCETIMDFCFVNCWKLESIDLPMCSSIGKEAFAACKLVSSINIPLCEFIGVYAFRFCGGIKSINLPKCSYINTGAFKWCSSLQSVYAPICETIAGDVFFECENLKTISLPKCVSLGGYAFRSCSNLTHIDIPMCEYIGSNAFQYCSNLQSIKLPKCSYLNSYTFYDCTNLDTLTLGYKSVVGLYNSSVFYSTKITSTTGSILVPASLVEAYKASIDWSYFSDRIFPIE